MEGCDYSIGKEVVTEVLQAYIYCRFHLSFKQDVVIEIMRESAKTSEAQVSRT